MLGQFDVESLRRFWPLSKRLQTPEENAPLRLFVEALEDRRVLSATVMGPMMGDPAGDLVITGTGAAEEITLGFDDVTGEIVVTGDIMGGGEERFDASLVEDVIINLGGGNDVLNLPLIQADAAGFSITVDMGLGNDDVINLQENDGASGSELRSLDLTSESIHLEDASYQTTGFILDGDVTLEFAGETTINTGGGNFDATDAVISAAAAGMELTVDTDGGLANFGVIDDSGGAGLDGLTVQDAGDVTFEGSVTVGTLDVEGATITVQDDVEVTDGAATFESTGLITFDTGGGPTQLTVDTNGNDLTFISGLTGTAAFSIEADADFESTGGGGIVTVRPLVDSTGIDMLAAVNADPTLQLTPDFFGFFTGFDGFELGSDQQSGTIRMLAPLNMGTGIHLHAGMGDVLIAAPLTLTSGGVTISGDGSTTTINANMTAAFLDFNDSVEIGTDVMLTATAGNITFQQTVDNETGETNDLTLDATGNITFMGNAGMNEELDVLTIVSATQADFDGTVELVGNLDITAGAVSFDQAVTTTGGGTVEITNSGLLTIAAAADFNVDGTWTQNGAGAVNLAGDVTTTGDAVSFATAVTLTDNVTINTTGGGNAGGANVTFASTLDSSLNDGRTLAITAGTAGIVTFAGAVGGAAAGSELGTLTIVGAIQADFDNTVELVGNLDVTAGAVSFDQAVTTTNGGTVEITNSGLLTIAAAADFNVDGTWTQNGAAAVNLAGDVTTTGDAVSFATAVTLTDNVTINTTGGGNAGGANVTFASTLDSSLNDGRTLAITAGTAGIVTFAGAVGGTAAGSELGTLTINSGAQANFDGTVELVGNLDITAGAVSFDQAVTTTGGGTVEITNSGLLTIAAAADFNVDGTWTQNGAGAVNLAGDITTTGDAVSFATAVTLTDNVAIDTTGGGNAGGANVTFASTLDSSLNDGRTLAITAGTAGIVTFAGAVGGTAAGSELGALTINSGAQANFDNTVELVGNLDVTAGAVSFDQAVTTTGGGTVEITNSGLLTIAAAADFNVDGTWTQNGAGAVNLAGDVTTTGDAVSFATAVTLTDNVTINTTGGGNAGGANVTFASTLDSSLNDGRTLAITAGTAGIVTFAGAVGGTAAGSELGALTINSGAQANFDNTVELVGNLDITAGAVSFDQAVTTTGGGTVEITNSGLLTIAAAADFNVDGTWTQNGTGAVSLAGDVTTTGDAVSFATAVTLTDNVAIDTTNAGGNAGGANVTFSSTIDAANDGVQSLTLDAGTGGDVAVAGTVGAATRLNNLTVDNARNVTFSSTVRLAGNLTQTAGTGTTAFNGTSGTGIGGQLDVTTDAVTFSTADVVTVGAVSIDAQNAITLNAGAGIDAGASTITLATNQDNAGAQGFVQDGTAVIQTTNNTAAAVAINVQGTGGAAVGDVRAVNGRVTIDVGGAITDNFAGGTNVTATELALDAATGIGTDANAVEVDVNTLAARTVSGDVHIVDTGDGLTIGMLGALTGVQITGGGAGDNITVNANGSLVVDNPVTNTGGGNILLAAGCNLNTDDLTLNADVSTTGNGSITLHACDAIFLAMNVNVDAAGTGNVLLSAGTDRTANGTLSNGTATGEIVMNNGSRVTSDAGNVTLRAPGDVHVYQVDADDDAAGAIGNVSIEADFDGVDTGLADGAGAIIDVFPAGTNVTANEVDLEAATGIGTDANALEIDADLLAARTISGDVHLVDTGDGLTIGMAGVLAGVQITGGAVGDNLTVHGNGPLVVNAGVSNTGGGTVLLAAGGNTAADDLSINAGVSTTGNGDVTLLAGDSITVAMNVNVDAAGTGAALLSAGTDRAANGTLSDGNAAGQILMVAGSRVTSDDGDVTLRAPDDVRISQVDANDDMAGAVGNVLIEADFDGVGMTLSDGVGAIIDVVGDGTTNVTANNLTLRAATDIGEIAGDITDAVPEATFGFFDPAFFDDGANGIENFVSAASEAPGTDTSINIALSGQLLEAVVTEADGEIFLHADGDLTVAAGAVNPDANGVGTALIVASGNLNVSAAGAIVVSPGDNDNIGLVAGGTLTIPATGYDVSGGALRLRGNADVTDGDHNLGSFVANSLDFFSGSNTATTVNTEIVIFNALMTTDGTALTANEADGIVLESVVTTRGDVTINAASTGAGDIEVMLVDAQADSTGADPSIVTLDASTRGGAAVGGAIVDADGVDLDVIGGAVSLRALTGIATDADALEINAQIVGGAGTAAAVTQTGDVNLLDTTGGLIIGTVAGVVGVQITDGTAADNITVVADGALNVESQVTNDGGAGDVGGEIALAAQGAGSVLDVNAVVTTETGSIDVAANANLVLNVNGLLTTVSTATDAVRLTSTTGAVVDMDAVVGDLDVDAADGRLIIDAAMGIGDGDAIDTRVDSIDVVNSTDGQVDVLEADDVDVFRVNQSATDAFMLTTVNGSINVTEGDLGVTTAGDAMLTANGANLEINEFVDAAGNLVLNADMNLVINDDNDDRAVDVAGATVTGNAGMGVDFDSNNLGTQVIVASNTGRVADVTPDLVITTPNGDFDPAAFSFFPPPATATVVLTLGRPGEQNQTAEAEFQNLTINDMQPIGTENVAPNAPLAAPELVMFTEQVTLAGNVFTITIRVADDPNITFFENNVELQVADQVFTFVAVQPFVVIGELPRIEARPLPVIARVAFAAEEAPILEVTDSVDPEEVLIPAESQTPVDERIIIVEKIDAQGQIAKDVKGADVMKRFEGDEADEILQDPSDLFRTLRSGRFRIWLQDGTGAQPTLIRDVTLREGVPSSEGRLDLPPTERLNPDSSDDGEPQADSNLQSQATPDGVQSDLDLRAESMRLEDVPQLYTTDDDSAVPAGIAERDQEQNVRRAVVAPGA